MDNIKTTILEARYVSFDRDGDIRSPRTPVWLPPTPALPFEYERILTPPANETKSPAATPPPTMPLPWVWQCHLCRNRYALGVTRRCLYDGHYYCSGDTVQPNLKKKKGRACSSEFDYEGWEEYGDWKQKILQEQRNPRVLRGCETCVFPSQCRTPAALCPPKKEKKKVVSPVVEEPAPVSVPQQKEIDDKEIKAFFDKMMETASAPAHASDFDSILKDLMRDEEELLKDESSRKRSKSKERNYSKKLSLSPREDKQMREEVAQSLSDLVMPIFESLSGKTKTAKPKST